MKTKIIYLFVLFPLFVFVCGCDDNTVESIDINKANSLILYLPFNGNANDESGKGNNATTITASLTEDRFGKSDSAYYFNGSSSYLQIPTSISLVSPEKGITMCAWIRINNWCRGNWAPVLTKSNTDNYGMYTMMILEDNKLEIELNNSRVYYPYTFNLNSWYFIVFSWDSMQGKYYVNGNLIGSNNWTGSISIDSKPLIIGKDTPEATEYLDGKLDDIRIFNYAISDSLVNTLYHENGWK